MAFSRGKVPVPTGTANVPVESAALRIFVRNRIRTLDPSISHRSPIDWTERVTLEVRCFESATRMGKKGLVYLPREWIYELAVQFTNTIGETRGTRIRVEKDDRQTYLVAPGSEDRLPLARSPREALDRALNEARRSALTAAWRERPNQPRLRTRLAKALRKAADASVASAIRVGARINARGT